MNIVTRTLSIFLISLHFFQINRPQPPEACDHVAAYCLAIPLGIIAASTFYLIEDDTRHLSSDGIRFLCSSDAQAQQQAAKFNKRCDNFCRILGATIGLSLSFWACETIRQCYE